MRRKVRARFWVEAAICAAGTCLLIATLVSPAWIEVIFNIDPDAGSGALEWAVVAAAALTSALMFAAARIEWGPNASGCACGD